MTTILDQRRQQVTVTMHQDDTVSVAGKIVGRWRREGLYPSPRWVLVTADSRLGYGTARGLRHGAVQAYYRGLLADAAIATTGMATKAIVTGLDPEPK